MFNDYNSKVTLELREIVESGINIWDFDYPSFYQGDDKLAFERKVIDHYYFRQIGQETVGRFLHYFRSKIREIMPYYIKRYESVELLESVDDPLQSYDLTEELTRETSSEGSSSASGTVTEDSIINREHRLSDTPQGSIDNLDDYMSEASKDREETAGDVNSSSESSNEGSGTEHYKLTRKGNIGVQPLGQEINELRKAYINVDMEVIEELNELFLKLY